MQNRELEKIINQKLNSASFQDYAPNGIQVEGRKKIKRIITGVTACQALLDEAVKHHADAIIVHHGYFWKNESPIITGIKYHRLRTLLINNMNLYAWHLPLDAHPELGNNAQLAKDLFIEIKGEIQPLVFWGELSESISAKNLRERIIQKYHREPLQCSDNAPEKIKRIAWCTGGGQGFIDAAAAFGVDAYITGEVSEKTIHSARENGIHFFAAGHHATERAGIKALGEWLAQEYHLEVMFIDIDNPA